MKQSVQVLVVDDEPTVRRSLRILLEHDGHKVWDVDNGDAALGHLDERVFDLVITDFFMPGMRGDQLVSRIRQRHPTQPIIMATGYFDEFRQTESSQYVDVFLEKPFSFDALREAIGQALSRCSPNGQPPSSNQ